LVEQLLLALQVAFVVLLYLFIWRVVRTASRDMAVGQESMILTPVKPAPPRPARPTGRLVVVQSPEFETGTSLEIGRELLAGREASSDVRLPADGYASGRHARFVRGEETDVVEDLNSTNGTFVNGDRLTGSRPLRDGDMITLGQTQLKYEDGA
jgi:pSer/pThr/pTyr-binding forkhead associated (FHA) protein